MARQLVVAALFRGEFARLSPEMIPGVDLGRGRSLEGFLLQVEVDERIALRIESEGAHGQAEVAIPILFDQEWACFGVGHVLSP